MTSQPTGNRSHSVVDDSTRLLAPFAKEADATELLARFNWMLDEQTRREAERIEAHRLKRAREDCERNGHVFTVVSTSGGGWCIHCGDVPPTDDATAVIPKVAPAKPAPIVNGEPYNDHPWCRKKIAAIGLLFGAGVVAGIPIGMVLAFVFIVAKVVA